MRKNLVDPLVSMNTRRIINSIRKTACEIAESILVDDYGVFHYDEAVKESILKDYEKYLSFVKQSRGIDDYSIRVLTPLSYEYNYKKKGMVIKCSVHGSNDMVETKWGNGNVWSRRQAKKFWKQEVIHSLFSELVIKPTKAIDFVTLNLTIGTDKYANEQA